MIKEGTRPVTEDQPGHRHIPRDLLEIRTYLGLTQTELAEMVGVQQQTIARAEHKLNMPTPINKMRIVRKLDEHLKVYAIEYRRTRMGIPDNEWMEVNDISWEK